MTALAEQRKALPDAPGVYLFKDENGKVIYVGKAKSIRKRVASHFSKPTTRGDMSGQVRELDFVVTQTEAEALLTEQRFIKQHRPLFNVRLRDDKSYPYIAISLDEDFPRVYFTRERHRRNRAYFGPFSNAKGVRETLDLLGKVFQHRTCDGPEPGRASGSPRLDYYIQRGPGATPAFHTTSGRARAPASATPPRRPTAATSRSSSTSCRAATGTSSAS